MNTTIDRMDQDHPQDRHLTALWNMHRNLTRIADELADAARDLAMSNALPEPLPESNTPDALTPRAYFETLLRQGLMREQFFGSALFGAPAWNIMIELMLCQIDGAKMKMSELGVSFASSDADRGKLVQALIESRLVDSFPNADNDSDDYVALSGEAAGRMAELYRARARG